MKALLSKLDVKMEGCILSKFSFASEERNRPRTLFSLHMLLAIAKCLIVTPPNRKLSRKLITGLRSRRLEVVGETENGRARGGRACLLLAHPFFLVPTNSKRLLRRLANNDITTILGLSSVELENGEALNTITLAVRISMTIAL